MAWSEAEAQRVRGALAGKGEVVEKRMMGGLVFMVDGHMCCGLNHDALMVRVGADQRDAALALPHTWPMEFAGRSPKGFIYVSQPGVARKADLAAWIGRGLSCVAALPPKISATMRPRPSRRTKTR